MLALNKLSLAERQSHIMDYETEQLSGHMLWERLQPMARVHIIAIFAA
jgi:hypothetical protein